MNKVIIVFFVLFNYALQAQNKTENIIIITTDGFRWQDVFKGMDSAIANNTATNNTSGNAIENTTGTKTENNNTTGTDNTNNTTTDNGNKTNNNTTTTNTTA